MKYHALEEFYRDENADRKGIVNRPPEKHISNIIELVHSLFEPLRDAWGKYCRENHLGDPGWEIIAGYRSDALNHFYDGKKSSPHLKGFAVNFRLDNGEYAIFHAFAGPWLRDNEIRFDELIWNVDERYIHLSLKNNEGKQRSHIKKE